MSTSPLEDFVTADAQGERALFTLWPGDSFLFRGEFHEILSMQIVPPQSISVKTDTGHHFLLHGLLVFPTMLSDEHFQKESGDQKVW